MVIFSWTIKTSRVSAINGMLEVQTVFGHDILLFATKLATVRQVTVIITRVAAFR